MAPARAACGQGGADKERKEVPRDAAGIHARGAQMKHSGVHFKLAFRGLKAYRDERLGAGMLNWGRHPFRWE